MSADPTSSYNCEGEKQNQIIHTQMILFQYRNKRKSTEPRVEGEEDRPVWAQSVDTECCYSGSSTRITPRNLP